MLTFEENRQNFIRMNIISRLNLIPFTINVKTGQIRMQESKRRLLVWRLFYAYFLFHGTYILFRLMESLVFADEYFNQIHFSFHFLDVGSTWVVAFWIYEAMVKRPGTVIKVWNSVFAKEADEESTEGTENKEIEGPSKRVEGIKKRSLLNSSLQEIFQLILYHFAYWTTLFTVVLLTSDPSRRQLLYTMFPEGAQNAVLYVFLVFVEAFKLTFEPYSMFFVLILHLALFDKCNAQLTKATEKLLKMRNANIPIGPLELSRAYKKCRENHVLILLFNLTNRHIIFAFKIYCISYGSLLVFFAIRFFDVNPLVGGVNYYIGILLISMYAVLYDKAFCITDHIKDLKEEILLGSMQLAANGKGVREKQFGIYMIKAVSSIPGIGIQVGGFNNMERLSTFIFLDFVANQVVSLLVGV